MAHDRFQGDPRLTLDGNGASMSIKGGQPVMDQGFENVVLLDLFVKPGWWGNTVLRDDRKHIGSDFEETAREPATVADLIKTETAARVALQHMLDEGLASDILVSAQNPQGDRLDLGVVVKPPGSDLRTLLATKHGPNWIAQRDYPANGRL